jgi:low affinity Fe/Cu permease
VTAPEKDAKAGELRPFGDETRHATRRSRWTHRLGDATTHSNASIGVLAAVVVWGVIGVVADFPRWWTTGLFAVTSAATLVMVFIVQHTQARLEIATQRKLDELLRAMPGADGRLIAAEVASDAELAHIGEQQLRERRAIVEPEGDEPDGSTDRVGSTTDGTQRTQHPSG